MLGSRFKMKRQLYIWFFSYFIFVAICIAISLILYFTSLDITRKEIEKNMYFTIDQMRSFYDTDLLNAQNFTYSILESNNVKSLSDGNISDNYSTRRKQYNEICNSISLHSSNNIQEFFIVFNGIDLCLDSSGSSSKQALFSSNFSRYYDSMESWLKDMEPKNQFSDYRVLKSDSTKKNFFYIQRTPINSKATSKAFAIALLDIDKIINDKLQFTDFTKPIVTILSGDNSVIFSSEPGDSDGSEYWNDTDKYITTSVESKFMNIKYVLTLPTDSIYKDLYYLRALAIICCLLFLFIGIILSYYLSKRSYAPLSGLLIKFDKDYPRGSQNEFSYLEDKIGYIFDKNKNLQKAYDSQTSKLQDIYLSNLLLGRRNNFTSDKTGEVRFKKSNFNLILFKVRDRGILTDNTGVQDGTVNFLIKNVFTEITEDIGDCFFFICESNLACILNSGKQIPELELCSKVEFTIEFLQENFATQIISAVSDTAESESQLPFLFNQATDIMSVSKHNSNLSVLASDSLDEFTYVYSPAIEQILIAYLNSGDYNNASVIVKDVLFKSTYESNSFNSLRKILISDLAATLLKASPSIDNNRQFLNMINELFNSDDISEAQETILSYMKILCDSNKENSEDVDLRIHKITELIRQDYSNPNLNVSYVANKFDITINYLSTYFKAKTGQSLSAYIMGFRLKKACELLKQDVSVTKTCRQCGFSDVNAFIRAFKKNYGTTPGKYSSHKKND